MPREPEEIQSPPDYTVSAKNVMMLYGDKSIMKFLAAWLFLSRLEVHLVAPASLLVSTLPVVIFVCIYLFFQCFWVVLSPGTSYP
jgi:hypothetical protein